MAESTTQSAIKIIAYVTGAISSLAVLGVSLYKVAGDSSNPVWWSMISSIVSIYIPSPLQFTSIFNKQTTQPMTALQELKTIA